MRPAPFYERKARWCASRRLGPISLPHAGQGWRIEVIDLHTVKLSHPEAGVHVVNDRKGGGYARRALRRAIAAIRRGGRIAEDGPGRCASDFGTNKSSLAPGISHQGIGCSALQRACRRTIAVTLRHFPHVPLLGVLRPPTPPVAVPSTYRRLPVRDLHAAGSGVAPARRSAA